METSLEQQAGNRDTKTAKQGQLAESIGIHRFVLVFERL